MGANEVETVVETLPRVGAKVSSFIERDGDRLLLKQYRRGALQHSGYLRAVAIPIGSYEVVGTQVIHRYHPDRVVAELTRHQHLVRMRSPAFLAVAKRIAKRIGGPLAKFVDDDGVWIGYAVRQRRGAPTPDLVRIQREHADDLAVVFATSTPRREDVIGIAVAERALDLVPVWCHRWDEQLEAVLQLIDRACGARLIGLTVDMIELQLDRKPARPTPIAKAIHALEELESDSLADQVRALNDRRVLFWWD